MGYGGRVEGVSDVPGPALAAVAREPFARPGWVYERKLDGMRVLASRSSDEVRLRSRTGGDAGRSFPELVDALSAAETPDFVADGEVVAFDGDRTSFGLLQSRMHVSSTAKARRSPVAVVYYVFDLLHLDGHSTRALPLTDRKALLSDLFEWRDPMRYTEHREGDGRELLEQACGSGWEGLIAKRAGAPYRPGRSPDWLKLKCELRQELVVGGWTDPQGARSGFGALLLGYYDARDAASGSDASLRYAGKVGTGFDQALLASIGALLDALATDRSPYDERTLPAGQAWRRSVHWVEPQLLAEVAFSEWTREGQLRHPRFLGLRADKDPREVVREPASPAAARGGRAR